MKNVKKLVGLLLVVLMMVSLAACTGSQQAPAASSPQKASEPAPASTQKAADKGVEPMKLTLSHHVSETDSNHVFAKAFAEAVKKLSDGKMTVEIYANGQLFGQKDALSALRQGTLDIALSDTALFANFDPAGALFDMPYLIESRQQAINMVKNDEVMKVMGDKMIKAAGIRVLSVQPLYFRSSLVKNMNVNSFESFKGIVMRTPEAPHTIAAFKAFGANPTVIPSGEAYTAVQTGVADGLEGHPEYVYLQKFYEVAKNYVQTKHVFTFTAYSMSQKKYDSMSDAQREVLNKAVVMARDAFLDYTKTLFEDSLANLEKKGAKITEVDLKPFKAATADYLNKFVKDNNLQGIYDKIQTLK